MSAGYAWCTSGAHRLKSARVSCPFGLNKILNMLKNFLEVGRVTYTLQVRSTRITGALNTFRTRPAHAEHTFQARRIRYVRVSILTGCWFGRVWNAPVTCAKRMKRIQRVCSARLACLGRTTNVLQNFEIFYTSGTRLSHELMCDCKSELKEQINFIRPKSSAC